MHTPEWHEKQAIKKYLDSIGAWHFSPHMRGFGGNGVPDIIGCYAGIFIGIEVKREGAKPTKLQDLRMKQIHKVGGFALWGTAKKVIRELDEWAHGRD